MQIMRLSEKHTRVIARVAKQSGIVCLAYDTICKEYGMV